MAGKHNLDVVTLRDCGRIVNVEPDFIKALIFRDKQQLQSRNLIMEFSDFYDGVKAGDYFVYEEGKVGGLPAQLCEKVKRVGLIERIRGTKVVLKKEDAPVPEFKNRILMEDVVQSEHGVAEGDAIVYRKGRIFVGGSDPVKKVYSCYAVASDREIHAAEKRTH